VFELALTNAFTTLRQCRLSCLQPCGCHGLATMFVTSRSRCAFRATAIELSIATAARPRPRWRGVESCRLSPPRQGVSSATFLPVSPQPRPLGRPVSASQLGGARNI
jgi:hypothetical protein